MTKAIFVVIFSKFHTANIEREENIEPATLLKPILLLQKGKMGRDPLWVFFIVILFFFPMANSVEEAVKKGLVDFFEKLAPKNGVRDVNWGWNLTSDPCTQNWIGVSCYTELKSVKKIILPNLNSTGILDASSLCEAVTLKTLDLSNNQLQGLIPDGIRNCRFLTHLYLKGNNFSGDLPVSLGDLDNLKKIDISGNNFSGALPDIHQISGLVSFLAQNNKFSGEIPEFDFSNLREFNVSNNNFSGPIPNVGGKFSADSFLGNPNLCGRPLPNVCQLHLQHTPLPENKKRSLSYVLRIYSGYAILGIVVLVFFIFKLIKKLKTKKQALNVEKKKAAEEVSNEKPSEISNEGKSCVGLRAEYSLTSAESGRTASTLVVLSSPLGRALKFKDLLRAPADLIGRGKHGSLYKVMLDNGLLLAVKRIKEWAISKQEFERRMQTIDQTKHPYVLPPVAYYCSLQEKVLVYEYQQNGSLFQMLHGSQSAQTFDWESRLNVAANIAEGLACMHEELQESGIAHGNLKSSNILFDKKMDPCISEYGLMVVENQYQHALSRDLEGRNMNGGDQAYSTFKVDIYAFGVILLELLTGKVVHNNGYDLASWVNSVVREEWTIEVFEKSLVSAGASEERMVNLLQVALKCINPSANERPSMCEVAQMIITLREEDERSIAFEP